MKKYRAIGDGISRVSYITTTVGSFSVVDLYMEWKIWSRCFGKVVVINGVSSSGKSTLSHYLSNFGFNIISLDSVRDKLLLDYADKHFKIPITQIKKFLSDTIILKVLCGFKFTEVHYDKQKIELIHNLQKQFFNFILQDNNFLTTMQIFEQMYDISKKFIFSGQNVLLDVMAYGKDVDMLRYSFRYYPMKIGLLYNSLEENLNKCFQRNYLSLKKDLIEYRHPLDIMEQYKEFYQFVSKDSIFKYGSVFEKVSKGTIKNVLEIAIHFQILLLNNFKYNLIADDAVCFMAYDDKIKKIYELTEMFKTLMILEADIEVFVVPRTEYDFVIKTSDLQMMNRKLISDIRLQNKQITMEDILKFYHKRYSVITENIMEKLSDMRFVIYNQETLPTIIGHNGPIIEFEFDDELKILGEDFNF